MNKMKYISEMVAWWSHIHISSVFLADILQFQYRYKKYIAYIYKKNRHI